MPDDPVAYPVSPDTTIKPGERVRSYDFFDRTDCYVEGTVQEITGAIEGCPRYKISIERAVFAGEDVTADMLTRHAASPFIFPPVNGTPTWLGKITRGVVRAESAEATPEQAPRAPRP